MLEERGDPLRMEGTSGRRGMTVEGLNSLVLQDIRRSMRARSHQMKRCLFFHLVSGGNVAAVQSVLEYLAREGHQKELDWILNRTDPHKPSRMYACVRRLVQGLIFVSLLLVVMVTTPIFYILHAMSVGWRDSSRRRISEDPQLPLVFAVYSKNPDMVRVLFAHGVTIQDHDGHNNNIFHYLSDLSAADPAEAISLHTSLLRCLRHSDDVRDVIVQQENRAGLSPLELSARWGSMKYAEFLVLQKGLIRETLVSVDHSTVWIDDKYLSKVNSRKHIIGFIQNTPTDDFTDTESVNCNGNRNTNPSGSSKPPAELEIAEYDLHRYERGDTLGKQSYLLQLITSRTIRQMTDRDITSFLKTDFLHTWMKRKSRRFVYLSVAAHCVHVLLTILLVLYLVHFGGDMNPLPLLRNLVNNYLVIRLDLFVDNVDGYNTMTSSSINSSVPHDVDIAAASSHKVDWSASARSRARVYLPRSDVPVACDNGTEVMAGLVLDQCLAQSLRMVLDTCQGLSLQDALQYSGVKLFLNKNFFDDGNMSKLVALVMWMFILGHMIVDFAYRVIFLVRNLKMTHSVPYVSLLAITTRRFPGSYVEKQLWILMYSMFTVYLAVYWHLEHDLRQYFSTTFKSDLKSVLETVQREKFTLLINGSGLIYGSDENSFMSMEFLPSVNEPLQLMSYLLIACLILRFLLAIHMLRLMPGVGFFVITARKMARHLIEFVLVFLLVAVAFATVFHFVMRDPECPANRVEGFSGLAESLFSTYLIAIGQAEFIYFKNTNAQIAFVVYTVITVLLLFNLIIAVMSTTADALNRASWRQALCVLETWDEILGVEATCQTMSLPLDFCIRLVHGFFGWRQKAKMCTAREHEIGA